MVYGIAPSKERNTQDIVHMNIESLNDSGTDVVTFLSIIPSMTVTDPGIRKAIKKGEKQKLSSHKIPANMGRKSSTPPILSTVAR